MEGEGRIGFSIQIDEIFLPLIGWRHGTVGLHIKDHMITFDGIYIRRLSRDNR